MIIKVFCSRGDIKEEDLLQAKKKLSEHVSTCSFYFFGRDTKSVTITSYNHELWPNTKLKKVESEIEDILFGGQDVKGH